MIRFDRDMVLIKGYTAGGVHCLLFEDFLRLGRFGRRIVMFGDVRIGRNDAR